MSATSRVINRRARSLLALVCACAIAPGNVLANVQSAPPAAQTTQAPPPAAAAARIPADQLDSLVAPIALYPDPLLAQVLAASTYPLELVQLQQWLMRNPGLKDKALVDAVEKQPWDPSVQAMSALPDVVKRLTDDIAWTTDLGNAFLAQESDVMNAVQRMRSKAQAKGTLKSTPQQTVETQVVENKHVIVIEQADPQVVYVPSYDPVVVYGAPVYPYPPIYYPTGYYAAGAAISFGLGVAMGAAWGGGWGWGAGWGGGDINVNNFNNFNRNANINGGNRVNALNNRSGTWQHNPQHRGGAPYRDQATANRFGGTARGDSLANRQAGARQQLGRQGGNLQNRAGAVGTTGRAGAGNLGGGNLGGRAQGGQLGGRAQGGQLGGRAQGGQLGGGNLGGRAQGQFGGGNVGGGNLGGRAQAGQLGGGSNRIGSRDLSRSGAGNGAFGGAGGFSGSAARGASQRGSSSMSRSRPSGGNFSRGGGGRSFGGGGGRSFGGGGGRSRGGGGRRR
jgi:hypothetical protein